MTDKNLCSAPCQLRSSKIVALLCMFAMAFLVLLALSNWHPAILQLFGYDYSLPIGAMIVISLVVGFFAGLSDLLSLNRGEKQEKIKGEWQVQDAKLAASITSDREKQLEAKISTLETALEKALKKE